MDKGAPAIISTLVDVIPKQGGLSKFEISKEVQRASKLTKQTLIDSGFQSLLDRNIIIKKPEELSSITESDYAIPKPSLLKVPKASQRFYVSSSFDKLDENAPKIARTILR